MRRSREVPELLAPAGSWEGLEAAIESGADAVYLAGKRFGARHGAKNFDDPELEKAIDRAHLRGVKVYVTVNTLIPALTKGGFIPAAEREAVAEKMAYYSGLGKKEILDLKERLKGVIGGA